MSLGSKPEWRSLQLKQEKWGSTVIVFFFLVNPKTSEISKVWLLNTNDTLPEICRRGPDPDEGRGPKMSTDPETQRVFSNKKQPADRIVANLTKTIEPKKVFS